MIYEWWKETHHKTEIFAFFLSSQKFILVFNC